MSILILISFTCWLYLFPKFEPFIILIDKLLFKLILDSKKVADNTARVLVYKVHHPLNTLNLSTDHQTIGYNIVYLRVGAEFFRRVASEVTWLASYKRVTIYCKYKY